MQKTTFKLLLLALMIAALGNVSAFAQQAVSTEKKALIDEFRRLISPQDIKLAVNISAEDTQKNLSSMVEQDKGLTEAQRQDLMKLVAEAMARLDKQFHDFFAGEEITEVEEDAIYQVYDKNFNESELREMIAFYRTPTGRKYAAFVPGAVTEVKQVFSEAVAMKLHDFIEPKIEAETEQLRQRIKEMKAKKGVD